MSEEISAKQIELNLVHLRQLVFEVTDACNLRCKYCGYADLYEGYDKRENLRFPMHRAKLIIDYLYEYWKNCDVDGFVEPISIGFYGGEPLLNVPFIQNVIDYIENLPLTCKKFFYSMTSNAMLLDKYMDFLAEKEVRLLISLDGDREGQGYRVDAVGRNSFDRVFANINLLREKHPIYFKRFVNFNAVLHSKNSVEGIYNFIRNTFGKEPTISSLSTSGIRPDKISEFNKLLESIRELWNPDHIYCRNPELLKYIDVLEN